MGYGTDGQFKQKICLRCVGMAQKVQVEEPKGRVTRQMGRLHLLSVKSSPMHTTNVLVESFVDTTNSDSIKCLPLNKYAWTILTNGVITSSSGMLEHCWNGEFARNG